MAKLTDAIVATLKSYFNTGDQPTEAQFAALIDDIQAGLEEHTHVGLGDGDAAAILTAGIANDAVDDTKAGNRVLRLDRRQGGSGTGWEQDGITNYTPTMVRMQCGCVDAGTLAPGVETLVTVTFPVAFSNTPLVVLSARANGPVVCWHAGAIAGLVSAYLQNVDTASHHTYLTWIAVGPE